MATSEYPRNGSTAGSAQEKSQASAAEEDLNQLLTPVQRRQLMNLVKSTMKDMQETLCHPSEYCKSTKPSSKLPNAPASPPKKSQRSPTRAKSAIATNQVKVELDALDYFNNWRQSFLNRLNEVMELRPPTPMDRSRPREANLHPGDGSPASTFTGSCNSSDSIPPLEDLPIATRLQIINLLLLLSLSLESYNAHSRVHLVEISTRLGIASASLAENEIKVAKGLLQVAKEISASDEAKARAEKSKAARRWKIGLATVAGAVLVGVTGGLAAPLVAGSVSLLMATLGIGGTVAAGYLGAVAGSGVVIGALFGAFGARMTGRVMEKYAREVEDFAFIPLKQHRTGSEKEDGPATADNRLRVTIAISGWLTEPYDLVNPWRVLGEDSDAFALRWELEALLTLGNTMEGLMRRIAFTFAAQQIMSKTLLAPLTGPLLVPLVMSKLSHLVDNPFGVAKARAVKAGEILADALINKVQGERPVVLIGYSLGARVIYTCLLSLAKRRAFGLVESAILIGSPAPSDAGQWRLIRTVVSGRLVNVYSDKDLLLRFLYRTQSMQMNVAGIQPIEKVPGLQNFDASTMVSGHLRYPLVVGKILEKLGFDHLNKSELLRQSQRLHALDEEEETKARHDLGLESKESKDVSEQKVVPQDPTFPKNILPNEQKFTEETASAEAISMVEIEDLEEEIARRTEEGLTLARMQPIQMEDLEE